MRPENLFVVFFVAGLLWRGRTWSSWLLFLLVNTTADAMLTASYGLQIKASAMRGLCLFMGMFIGLVLMFMLTIFPKRTRVNAMWPTVLVGVSLAIGAVLLPEGLEGGLLIVGLSGTMITLTIMATGAWAPDLVFVCAGLLFGAPTLNLILMDTRDAGGFDGSRGMNWIVEQSLFDSDSASDAATDLWGLGEMAFISMACVISGMLVVPLLYITWVTTDDLQKISARNFQDPASYSSRRDAKVAPPAQVMVSDGRPQTMVTKRGWLGAMPVRQKI